MRLAEAILLSIGSLGLSGCVVLSSQPTSLRWTTGFWFWQGSSLDPSYSGQALDVLFVQVGTIRKDELPLQVHPPAAYPMGQWFVYGSLPRELPPAREYWLVYRYERQGVPDIQVASKLAAEIKRLQEEAQERHLNTVGLQLDIDSPTASLSRYADFIRAVRAGLPKELQISITALLDWFRDGTDIDDVIAQVDEFVPQFYDIGDPAGEGEAAIAAPIDAARWSPVFNRFRKRFRIGISSFGRARVIRQDSSHRFVLYGDLRPLDVATNSAFELQASRNAADETVLSYHAARKVKVGYETLDPGDVIQFIISTPDAIQAAVRSARQMKGYLNGVVFFRWPSSREDWAMQPDEALEAAGLHAARERSRNRVHIVRGDCAAVHCVDLYLESAGPLSPRPVRYRIRASTELEYFLPEANVPVHLAGATDLEIALPAYCARGRLYVGRAVSLGRC